MADALRARFKEDEGPHSMLKYHETSDPRHHLRACEEQWRSTRYPKELWVHRFIHSLDVIPKAWYLTEEKRRGTHNWQEVAEKFIQCFSFEGKIKLVTQALQAIKKVLFFPDSG